MKSHGKLGSLWFAVAAAILLLGRVELRAAPGDPKQLALPEVPPDLVDPEFATAIDLAAIRQAISSLDAKGLMDQAERLLLATRQTNKQHKSLDFAQLVRLALRIALDARDEAAVNYISAAFARLSVKDFDEEIKALRVQLGERTRQISAGPNVPLSETTPEAIVLYNAMAKQVKLALLVGDRRALSSMRQKIQALTELHLKQRQHLLILCDDAIASMPMNNPVQILSLQKLTATLYTQ